MIKVEFFDKICNRCRGGIYFIIYRKTARHNYIQCTMLYDGRSARELPSQLISVAAAAAVR